MEDMLIVIAVFFSSIIFSMLGLGGAIFYVPFFYWTGMELVGAITTSLLLNIVTSGSATVIYLRRKLVDLHIAVSFIIASATGAQIGAYFTRLVPVDILLLFFAILMIVVGLEMIFERIEGFYRGQDITGGKKLVLVLSGGMIVGILSGMLGIGGGSFIVPILVLMGYGIKYAAATSGFIVIFTSLSGFIAHLDSWEPDTSLIAYILVASFIGAQIGSHLMSGKIEAGTLKKLFGVILLLMAARIISGSL
ncbi:sulfite exporter TauE/SafE family protein [Methanolobus halotolerans]|uniref:Probable membrane transporter protein n=1 Tax=Methanolobus halotolerans TaxID=2052935 RepID=A0A4E0PUG7_9EURY|nr:sulfite exporter TauE/SafE family protein [Methanolobus halotolerans]TGC08738.1 sulfite exporter TauE/SafE family protein [Methanolobus halotolerans]